MNEANPKVPDGAQDHHGMLDQAPVGPLVRWFESVLPAEPSAEAESAIDDLLPDDEDERRAYVSQFSILIVLSSALASFGLLADSGAVVIGAMLVAPLMTPIMAAAAATVSAHNLRLVRAAAVIALGTALAIGVGWAVSLIAGGRIIDVKALPHEIDSRTFPGLLDLGIAITAGAAAGYVVPRRSALSALPGVGIAVALVPPLATVGITAELGLASESRNALLLYLTNLAAIVFAAGLVLLFSGFRPRQESGRGALRRRVALTAVVVLVIAIPLVSHTRAAIADVRLQSAVSSAVDEWDPDVRVVDSDIDLVDGRADVELILVGSGDAKPAWLLAEGIRDRFGGPVDLRVLYQGDQLAEVTAR